MNVDDFYAAGPVSPPSVGMSPFGAAPPAAVRPAAVQRNRGRTPIWPWVAAAVGVLALVVGLAVVLWPRSSGPSGPDLPMAKLFGQQTRTQLPQPVTPDDCAAAVNAFPKLAADPRAKAAFVDGCMNGG